MLELSYFWLRSVVKGVSALGRSSKLKADPDIILGGVHPSDVVDHTQLNSTQVY